ncbi:MAG: hypothetical protein P8M78_14145 [Myxococcota bacterium]|nr:hypothetical protein [Myxococcota bacterium]
MDHDTAGPAWQTLRVGGRRTIERWRQDSATPIGLSAGLVLIGILLSLWSRLNYDVAWLMVGANRLASGIPLYGEGFIDVNPPLAVYAMAPATALARITGIAEPLAVIVQTWLAAGLALLVCFQLLIRLLTSADQRPALWWLAGLTFAVCLMPALFLNGEAVAYAQREYWILLLTLPFLILTALRIQGLVIKSSWAVAMGIAFGIALCIKPHYLVVWIGLEGLVFLRRPLRSSFLRPENLAIAGTGLSYLLSLPLVTPGYLTLALPLALSSYWAYQTPWTGLINLTSFLAIAGATWSIRWTPRGSSARTLSSVFLVAAIGSFVAYLLGGTPWAYHALPFRTLIAVVYLAPWITRAPTRSSRAQVSSLQRMIHGIAPAVLVVAIAFASPGDAGRILRAQGEIGSEGLSARLADWIKRSEAPQTVAVLSTSVPPAFPAVSYAAAEWTLRFSCLWPLPAVLRSRYGSPEDRARLLPSRVAEIEAYLRTSIVQDFSRRPPSWVFVPQPGSLQGLPPGHWDLLNFLRADPRFEAIWSGYQPMGRLGSLRVFARRLNARNISGDASQ